MASRAQHFGIDADLLLDGFDAPEALPAAQERKIRQAVYDIYEQVLLGLEEIDGFLPQAEQARADCLNN